MTPTVLYIDSDAATRRLVTRVLVPAGVRVIEAATLAQGHQAMGQTRPDLVVVDVDVPGLDLDDFIPTLRQGLEGPEPFFVAVTADDPNRALAKATESGFATILGKPLDIDRLASDLEQWLPVSQSQVEPVQSEQPAEPLRSGGTSSIPPLWRRALAPLTVNLVRSVATSEGLLALRHESDDEWVVVAAHSLRPGVVLPATGTRVPRTDLKWLDEALAEKDPVVAHPTTLETSPLLPPECRTVLVAPVRDNGRAYGAVVLGERRQRTFGFPPAQIAQCLLEAGKIATVLRRFEQLDQAITERRRAIDEMRIKAAVAVALGEEHDAEREAIVRLGARLADRLRLSSQQRVLLEQALRVHDIGRVWLGRAVLSLGMLSSAENQALLEAHAGQTVEILTSLDCPTAVVDTVRLSQLPWTEATGHTGLVARMVAVIAAYEALTARGRSDRESLSPKDAVAEISSDAGRRFAPDVVSAFADLVSEARVGEFAAG
jgi:response regulator RpfG family c-di-GMP phosphodiesterase